jgi:hypothetical protein
MACDDDYVVDAGGNRILIGLTADETREFERLDDLISELGPAATDDIQSLNERRWLILYDKHQSSVKIFISIQNAMAFRKSRTAQASWKWLRVWPNVWQRVLFRENHFDSLDFGHHMQEFADCQSEASYVAAPKAKRLAARESLDVSEQFIPLHRRQFMKGRLHLCRHLI